MPAPSFPGSATSTGTSQTRTASRWRRFVRSETRSRDACAASASALVKDPELTVDPRAEALLYAAARAQLVAEQLVPLLDDGQWTAFLLIAVIGSGIASSRLSPNDVGLQLLENAMATAAALVGAVHHQQLVAGRKLGERTVPTSSAVHAVSGTERSIACRA